MVSFQNSMPYLVFGGLFFMLAMSSAPATKSVPESIRKHPPEVAKMVPKISVRPALEEDAAQVQAKPAAEIKTLAMNQPPANLPTSLTDLPAPPSDHKIIVLEDNGGSIVGQMAKIPLENEQITEIKPLQDIDNGVGRELLSIINKY